MRLIEHLQLLQRVDLLIRRKATGAPEELAGKLAVSRASVFRHINDLRALGAPIEYCRFRQYYYYEEEYTLSFDALL